MTRRPRLLDLFCGAGGAGVGYHRAGFDVTGVDIEPQPNYPYEFVQGDAISFLALHGAEFDVIHTSPPCQWSCNLTKGTNKGKTTHVNLIPATRALLALYDVPTVIENVQGSDLRRDLTLCGEMFGLGVIRHRYFEVSGAAVEQPAHIKHRGRVAGYRHGVKYDGPYLAVYGSGGDKGTVAERQVAMGIDWMTKPRELAESIPPAYTELIGAQLLAAMAPAEADPVPVEAEPLDQAVG